MTAMPQGTDFQVNSFITGTQTAVAIAADADGNFILVWQSDGEDGSDYGVFAQRYQANGQTEGSTFRVNSAVLGFQGFPAVDMTETGDFTIAWIDVDTDQSSGIRARRYSQFGNPQGEEIQVNTLVAGHQAAPDLAMDASGNFVGVWQQVLGDEVDIYFRRFDSTGSFLGGDVLVNTRTQGLQKAPAIAMNNSGDFTVVWASEDQDGSGFGIFGQRYDSAGAAQGNEFQVNTTVNNNQQDPAIAMADTGDFVVVWEEFDSDGSNGIYAQRYDSTGDRSGSEFQVNTLTSGTVANPDVAMNSDGDFIITWHAATDESEGVDIYARQYSRTGKAFGKEFVVNETVENHQTDPSIAMDQTGNFITAWSTLQTETTDVFARQFRTGLGTANNDRLQGTSEADTLNGLEGNDRLIGLGNSDVLIGGIDKDLLKGGGGDDVLKGNRGNDQLQAGNGSDRMNGGGGNDQLQGRKGDDLLKGGAGDDDLNGGEDSDRLLGGGGTNTLQGGQGADQFELIRNGFAEIMDFQKNQDKIGVKGNVDFNDLTFTASGNHTLIQLADRTLAQVNNTQPDELTRDHFL